MKNSWSFWFMPAFLYRCRSLSGNRFLLLHFPPVSRTIRIVHLFRSDNETAAERYYAKQFNISKLKYVIPGGKNGQDSIRNGVFELEKYFKEDDVVLIHDSIRPMVSADIISDCIVKTKQYGCAIATIPCAEAMLQTEDGIISTGSYPRDNLKRTQTPQGFPLGKICDLHRRALEKGITNSVASCTLMIEMGEQVYFSMGSEKNIKLTTVDDIDIFKALLLAKRADWLKD